MSDNDNSNDCNFPENEHNVFVQLLTKYRILFGTEKSPQINRKKYAAASALVDEYNKKCESKLTVRQVFKKVSNLKTRLKEKNYKNLTRSKKLAYTDREQMFLNIWVGKDTKVLANKTSKASKSSDAKSQPENITSDDITVKIEADDYELQDSSQISTLTSAHFWEDNSESERRFQGEEDEDDKYESMTLDELKHAALIAQIKTLKEQKAAAKSKRELNKYKLWFLKQKNRNV